jgi:hypothetical protein
LVGVAVNVTELPGQKGFAEGEIVMLTGRSGLTDTGYWMLDAGLFVVQFSEEVSIQEIKSPFSGV